MAKRRNVTATELGYTPSMEGIRGRVQGEDEGQYNRYVQRMQGEQARNLATQRGIDTSGQAWYGDAFKDTDRGFGRAVLSRPEIMIPLVVGGPLAYTAFTNPGALGFTGGAGGAAPEIATSTSPASVAAPTASGAVSGASGPASTMSGFGKFFSKGLDPTSLLMMGLGFLGGDDSGQQRQSFSGTSADPVQRLTAALDAIKQMGQGLQSRGPTRLRSSYAQAPPAPVQIPGLPFQIGGGLGVDPALKDPSLLESPQPDLGNLFGGATAQPRQRKPPSNG